MDEGLRIAGLDLLASWRNVVAHSRPRKSNLRQETKELLLENSDSIHQNYSHLDIELALKNFENRKAPVGKEVTSLLAMTVNLCREIDQAAVRRVQPAGQLIDVAAIARNGQHQGGVHARQLAPPLGLHAGRKLAQER